MTTLAEKVVVVEIAGNVNGQALKDVAAALKYFADLGLVIVASYKGNPAHLDESLDDQGGDVTFSQHMPTPAELKPGTVYLAQEPEVGGHNYVFVAQKGFGCCAVSPEGLYKRLEGILSPDKQ